MNRTKSEFCNLLNSPTDISDPTSILEFDALWYIGIYVCVCVCVCVCMCAFFCGEGPRNRCYGRTVALIIIVQPCDEED
jgi:hypothetical protein